MRSAVFLGLVLIAAAIARSGGVTLPSEHTLTLMAWYLFALICMDAVDFIISVYSKW